MAKKQWKKGGWEQEKKRRSTLCIVQLVVCRRRLQTVFRWFTRRSHAPSVVLRPSQPTYSSTCRHLCGKHTFSTPNCRFFPHHTVNLSSICRQKYCVLFSSADSMGHRGHVPPLLQMAEHGGCHAYRKTANKKLTKLYWPSPKRSSNDELYF